MHNLQYIYQGSKARYRGGQICKGCGAQSKTKGVKA